MRELSRKLCVAPMMDWTDRHYRYLARLISPTALLYTEMVTTGALIHGDREKFLDFNDEEHPLALQLGGSNADELARCAKLATEWRYDEVNLNVGCPSDRVQNNMIGACLMAEKSLVKDCLSAMREVTQLPVTIKHRIGIDELDSEQFLVDFVGTLREAGTETFIIHARKAMLQGLSPKQNREIPPLCYDRVYRLKSAFPDLEIIINGGIVNAEMALRHWQKVDGVMIGREAYHRPWCLAEVTAAAGSLDHKHSSTPPPATLTPQQNNSFSEIYQIGQKYLQYIERKHRVDRLPVWAMARHALGLFHGYPGGKLFRRHLSENAIKKSSSPSAFAEALQIVQVHHLRSIEREQQAGIAEQL